MIALEKDYEEVGLDSLEGESEKKRRGVLFYSPYPGSWQTPRTSDSILADMNWCI